MSIENNEFTDVMDEISVKNSLIRHLERENYDLKERVEICKENHIRYDIKAIDENTELKAELEKVKRCNKTMDGILLERDAEIKELKAELKDMKYYSSEYEKKAKAELKTANDGIDDLNDVLKDMQKESIEQIESNIGLQAECDDLRKACKLLKEDKAIQYLKADNKKRLNDLKLND